MRSCLSGLSVALVSAALLFGALPASAKPAETQHNSFPNELDRFASTLKAEGQRALTADAVAHAVHDGSAALAEAETDAAKQLQEFRATLNERKARLGMIGADTAERLETWKQAWKQPWKQETIAAWLDSWPDSWIDTISTIHGSATGALDRFRDWLKTPSASDEPTQIPV